VCGICGRLELEPGRPAVAEPVGWMAGRLAHRGPDDATLWHEGPVALGHRRLSIIDIDGGRQPISNEAEDVQVVFNGEIYNFRELGTELRGKGHRFRTRSDTEVIVHAYEEWGTDLLPRLDGMFAFALWDRTRQRLFLARDRLGIKPLFFYHAPARYLAFASEVKALWSDPDVPIEPDAIAIDQYMSLQYVPAPRTGLVGVWKLPPAHGMVVELGKGIRQWEYWDPSDVAPRDSRREAAESVRRVLGEAVKSHLVSDVPVGSFLSGGLDSSVVTALMAEAQAEPVRAITIGFREAGFDERPFARSLVARYGCLHHERLLETDAAATFDRVVGHLDEPFADWSTLPTFQVSQAAREQVKVVLSGDGGDELFGGYDRHRVHRLENLVRHLSDRLPKTLLRALVGLYPRWLPGQASCRLLSHDRCTALALKHAHRFFGSDESRLAIYGPAIHDTLGPADHRIEEFTEPFERYYQRARSLDPLNAALYVELKTYLVDDILTKVDRMSMSHSLEVRPPFLDHRVVELALSLPGSWKVGWLHSKLIYREAFRPLLPEELWRRPKQGFDIPAAEWLRSKLKDRAEDLLFGESTRQRGLVDLNEANRLWSAHQRGEGDYQHKLWALMMLEAWSRLVDRRRDGVPLDESMANRRR
jgi:asparagine synthase (glutamine-hydrolysing)